MLFFFTVLFYVLLASIKPSSLIEADDIYQYKFYIKILFIAFTASQLASVSLFIILHKNFLTPYFENMFRYKPLLFQLIKRDFITRYKRSFLGVLWSLLNPLLTMLILTMIFSYLFRFDIPNYPVYLLGGQLIFNFFSEATNTAMGSIIGGASMIKKVYIPKYIFPVSRVFSSLLNLFFSFIAFLIVFFITKAPIHATILLFPIPILYTVVFSLGFGMFLTSVAVFFRDLIYIYGVFITALTFFTPLFYPISILPPTVLQLLSFNPLYHFVTYFRSIALYGTIPGFWENMICVSFSLFALLAGTFVFMSQQDKYILHL